MMFGETVAVYCKNYAEHTTTLCRKTLGFSTLKTGGTYSYRYAL
jgi:hypothetical protein